MSADEAQRESIVGDWLLVVHPARICGAPGVRIVIYPAAGGCDVARADLEGVGLDSGWRVAEAMAAALATKGTIG